MNQDEIIEEAERQIKSAQMSEQLSKMNQAQQDQMMSDIQVGIVSEQLDLGDVLESIHNLLRGWVLMKNPETKRIEWTKPQNNDMVILSDYGVNYIMGAVQWYLNKNTLLSNYDDDQIRAKMEDLATTMADDIFMEYDKMFLYPTLEDCKKELNEKIKAKVDVRMYALELLGKKSDSSEIRNQILNEMEDRIENEMRIIKEQKIKNKLKRFESLLRFIQDTIHSAYQRAWKGQERSTLRQHTHISETRGQMINPPQQSSFNPLSILRRNR